MGCGCSQNGSAKRGQIVRAGPVFVADTPNAHEAWAVRTRAGVCAGCRHAEWRGGKPVVCSIDGWPVALKQHNAGACPLGKFPARWDRVVWCGLTWLGVPWPVRAYRGLRGPKIATPQPGCGCMAGPKLAWLRACRGLPRDFRAAWAGAPSRLAAFALRWAYGDPGKLPESVKST